MDGYRHWTKLGQAVQDSRAVRDALQAHGFAVTHKTDLNASELRETLDQFFIEQGSDKEAGLFLWFAGHGHTINGEGYLVPVDAPDPRVNDTEFRRRAFSMRDFGRLMREARAQHVLAVFDSCFAGSVFKTARSGVPPEIAHAMRYPVRQYISAGDHTQQVADDGQFQRQFLAAITGQAPQADTDQNGYVTGQELGIFLHNRLLSVTNGQQTPKFGPLAEGDFDRGDFVFRTGSPKDGRLAANLHGGPSADLRPPQQISRDPLAQLRTTQVYVASPVGAPGNGNDTLRRSITEALMAKGFEVLDHDREHAFKIHPVVIVKGVGLLVDEMTLRWQVFAPSKVTLGVIEEKVEVLSGSRNGDWGTSAKSSADYAAKRLVRYLSRPT